MFSLCVCGGMNFCCFIRLLLLQGCVSRKVFYIRLLLQGCVSRKVHVKHPPGTTKVHAKHLLHHTTTNTDRKHHDLHTFTTSQDISRYLDYWRARNWIENSFWFFWISLNNIFHITNLIINIKIKNLKQNHYYIKTNLYQNLEQKTKIFVSPKFKKITKKIILIYHFQTQISNPISKSKKIFSNFI